MVFLNIRAAFVTYSYEATAYTESGITCTSVCVCVREDGIKPGRPRQPIILKLVFLNASENNNICHVHFDCYELSLEGGRLGIYLYLWEEIFKAIITSLKQKTKSIKNRYNRIRLFYTLQ